MSIQSIMIVDDDKLSREFLIEAVTQLGYKAIEARSGAEALDKARQHTPDLMITDLRMPGIDGIELLKTMRTQHPEMPAVLVTAQGTLESAVQAMRNGAADFLLKPCTPEAIEVVLERIERTTRLMRENQYLRSEIVGKAPRRLSAKAP
jgi:DNA-binding NtrC family response regulator